MQSYAPPRRRSSTGVVITILIAFGFFVLCGLVFVAAGVLVFSRAESQQAHVVAQHEMARAQAVRAEAQVRERITRAKDQMEQTMHQHRNMLVESLPAQDENKSIRVANREITLQFDRQGKLKMDGKPLEQKQLKTALRDAGKGRESAIIVTIEADDKCQFEYVAAALSVCRELDVRNVRIATTD